ncbi:MAG TPA: AMP-binding protein, partial [Spirochaetota bacterium]|nr:AMP-binding protein [Spirochaetota bacterium]
MARNFLEYDYTHNTVIDIFNDHVLKSGDKIFLKTREKEGWRDLSWKESASQVEAMASFLISSGIKEGGIIPVYSGNRPEWCIADLAILSAGCADAAIFHLTPSAEAAQIVAETRSSICFCEGRAEADSILLRKRELPSLKKIITFDDPGFRDDMVISFTDALKEGTLKLQPDKIKERRKSVKNSDLMTVIYSSGTTGQPKGVMLSHTNVMFTLIKYNMRQSLPEGHTVLSVLPLSSASERIMGYYSTMLDNGTIAFSRGKDFFLQDLAEIKPNFGILNSYFAEKIYSSITGKIRKSSSVKQRLFNRAVEIGRQTAPSLMSARPLSVSQRLKYSIFSRLILARLKSVTGLSRAAGFIVTGGPILPVIHNLFWAMKIHVRKCYGLTESAGILNTDGDPGAMQVKTDGWITPFPETEIKTTVDGEILVKGPQIMSGYFNRPQETQDMYTSEGWLKTGDQGALDVYGYLNITDRKKDIIITSAGRKIA